MKLSNLSTIIATFSISAILYYFKEQLKEMGITIPDWIIGMIGISGLIYVIIIEVVIPFLKKRNKSSTEITTKIQKDINKTQKKEPLLQKSPESDISKSMQTGLRLFLGRSKADRIIRRSKK